MANLTLGLLGPLQVKVADAPNTTFESEKARALLAFLAVESHQPHRREALIGLLWPDCPEDVARRNLRQCLYSLRQTIGDHHANPPYLLISRDEIQFNSASDHALDVSAFRAHLAAANAHTHDSLETCTPCAQRLEQATTLYRGKFLQEFFLEDSSEFEEWAVVQREALHRAALEALVHLAAFHEQRAEYAEARGHAFRQLELDPWREEAHRQVMQLLAASGQRSEALAQFETCRRVLANELGVEPSAETRTLYEQIKSAERWSPARATVDPNGMDLSAKASQLASVLPLSTPQDLPIQLTPFVGRETELGDLAKILADPQCRLLTLVGPGGIGKTRLALQVASEQRETFAQGVAFVPLASTNSEASIVSAIAQAIGFSFQGPNDPKRPLLEFMSRREMLLVLDNVEHLLGQGSLHGDAVTVFLDILKHAPRIKLIVTSREQLNLQGEWVFEVEGLAIPQAEQMQGFEGYSAVSLFLQRARRARLGFVLPDAERWAITRICRIVDGTPLALELAAAWVRVLSCTEIAKQLEESLDFLTASMRDVPERHRSLRAVFDHSWNMLTDEERRVMSKLGVFSGGFQREAAERVAGASLSVLASLVAKSLVKRIAGERYDLHELVRQYARARLIEFRELESAQAQHMLFFLEFAKEAEIRVHGAGQLAWLDRLEKDHDNLRAALERSLASGNSEGEATGESEAPFALIGLGIAGALFFFWRRRSHWSEGRAWTKRALASSANSAPSRERAKALNVGVLLAVEQADTEEALRLSEENRSLAQKLGDAKSIAIALNSHGIVLWKQKDYAAARACCEQALALFRKLGDRSAIADSLHYLGHIAINQDDYQAAQSFLGENVALCRELEDNLGLVDGLGDLGLLAYLRNDFSAAERYLNESLVGFRQASSIPGAVAALNRMGDLCRCRGDYEQAGRLYSECLALYRDLEDKDEIPSLLHNLGYVALHRRDYRGALELFREALTFQRETGNQAGIAECLAGLAGVLTAQSCSEEAARLFGAAEAMREASGASVWPANRLEYERSAAILKRSLEESTLLRLRREGQDIFKAHGEVVLEDLGRRMLD